MGFAQYFCKVLRVAFSHALSVTQDCIFMAVLVVGVLIWFMPVTSVGADLAAWASALSVRPEGFRVFRVA